MSPDPKIKAALKKAKAAKKSRAGQLRTIHRHKNILKKRVQAGS